MKLRSFGATLTGIVVAFITIYLMEMLGMMLFPVPHKMKPENLEQLRQLLASIPVGALVTVAVGHGLAVLFGGWIINKIDPAGQVGLLVLFLLILVTTAMNLLALPHPLWFMITDLSAVIICGFVIWRVLNWK